MEAEVRFAQRSRAPGFPIAVPACAFAAYERASGSGLLITQRIAFGHDGVEPHVEKCRDAEMSDAPAHYRAVLTALARLAGADQSGRLGGGIAREFPFAFEQATVGARTPYTVRQLQNRVSRLAEFALAYPVLLPENLRSRAFHERLMDEVPLVASRATDIQAALSRRLERIALCHWNANVDNAWFWRRDGVLECGLMDWGCVGRMNVAMALWGAMSGAEVELWDRHLDGLLAHFVEELHRSGGARLEARALKRDLVLYAALMGLTWLLDAPPYIRSRVPDLADVPSRFDRRLRDDEIARTQLQMLSVFLNLWETSDVAGMLDDLLR
jgi:hypothetical protein